METKSQDVEFAYLIVDALDENRIPTYGVTYAGDIGTVHFFAERKAADGNTITYKIRIDRISG